MPSDYPKESITDTEYTDSITGKFNDCCRPFMLINKKFIKMFTKLISSTKLEDEDILCVLNDPSKFNDIGQKTSKSYKDERFSGSEKI